MIDPLTGATLVGVGANLLGGFLGNNAASGDRAEAARIQKEIYDKYNQLQTPDIEKLKLMLEEYQSAGVLAPEDIALVGQLGDTQLAGISTDPRLAQTQNQMLGNMEQLAETGMSAIDRNQLEQLLRSTNANTTANQKSVLENRARRGMAGSGDELAASLLAGQAGANRASSETLQTAADAMNRRMNATGQAAELAKSIETADYSRQAATANARDAIQQFNKNQAQNIATANTNTRNQAQGTNLQNQQNLMNSNTGLRNTQQQYNKDLQQRDFENQLKKLNGMSGAGNTQSTNLNNNADATSKMYSDIASGIGTIGAAYMKQGEPKDNDEAATKANRNKNLTPFGG